MPAVNTGIYFSWTIRDQSRMHQGRLRLRPWLEEQIESGQYPGVMWLDKTGRVFQIPWKHAARHGWNIDKDATLFRNWAMHTGKYKPGIDKPDPKTWKANFRCALNSLPDVKELQDKSMKKGSNAFRVYTLLPTTKTPKRRKGFKALNSDVRTGLPSLPPSTNTPLERFAEAFCRYREGDAGYSPDIFHKRDSFSSFNSMKQERPEDHFCPQSSLTPEAHGSREDTTDDHEQTEAVLKIVDHLKNMEHWNPSLEHDRGWRPATSTWMDCFCEAMDYSGYPLQTTCHIHSVPPSEFS